ncbi:GSU2403 family nucleotidyltransferase fold protein [Achromobacter insolitus]|uniref:GSU2403 family nucleotidyltransferase fold protein n=1 Tax=Achromobacter insolitus TaxID=217204 RepID=UPI00398FC773
MTLNSSTRATGPPCRRPRSIAADSTGSRGSTQRQPIIASNRDLRPGRPTSHCPRRIPSSARVEGPPLLLLNHDGFGVEVIRRDAGYLPSGPDRLLGGDDDFWRAEVHDLGWLLSAPKFEQIVIRTGGRMAVLTTVDPRAFGLFKTWLGSAA